jgi:hypothetical protein
VNYSAEVTAFVLARGNAQLDEVADGIGEDLATTKQLIGKLGAQGILRRDGDRVLVADKARAQTLAQQADGDYSPRTVPQSSAPRLAPPVALTHQPNTTLPKPATTRIPLATDVQIRSGIPLPPPRLGRVSPPCPWPLSAMEIGQMFEVAVPDGYEATDVANQVRKDIKIFDRLNPGRFFAVRTFENEAGKIAVGCWRESEAPVRGAHLKSAPKPAATVLAATGIGAMVAQQGAGDIPVFGKARMVSPLDKPKSKRA